MKKRLASLILALIMVFSCFTYSYADTSKGFKYSITPDSKQWKNYSSQELKEKINIPIEQAEDMDTETLLNTVLDYPYLIDIYAYDNTIKGIEFLSKEFNGMAVLLQRIDLAEKLLSNYKSLTTRIITSADGKNIGDRERIQLKCIEALFAYPKIYDKLSQNEKGEIVNNSLQLATKINATPISKQQVSFAIIQIPEAGDYFNTLAAGQYIESGLVMTPAGSYVVVDRYVDWTAAEKTAVDNQVAVAYPTATKLATASYKYNCHSYAWYYTSTSNTWWMNYPDAYMEDGSFSQHTNPLVNDRIYWVDTHSGIINAVSGSSVTSVVSKWGACGLYRHTLYNCPYSIVINKTYWGL